MSGHSKWATIKRAKGANDAARGQLFTRLSNAITIAVREGGGADSASNFRLRLAIDKAKEANMPKANIERAIERAQGKGGGAQLEQVMYEGFGPGGSALIIETLTENKQKSSSEIRNILAKSGGSLGGVGSVSYLFERLGQIVLKSTDTSTLLDIIVQSDATDFETGEGEVFVFTSAHAVHGVQKVLSDKGATISESELIYRPLALLHLTPELSTQVVKLLEQLDTLEYVHTVYTNVDFENS